MKKHHNHAGSRHNGRKAKLAARHAANRKRVKSAGDSHRPHNGLKKPGHHLADGGTIQAGPIIHKGGW